MQEETEWQKKQGAETRSRDSPKLGPEEEKAQRLLEPWGSHLPTWQKRQELKEQGPKVRLRQMRPLAASPKVPHSRHSTLYLALAQPKISALWHSPGSNPNNNRYQLSCQQNGRLGAEIIDLRQGFSPSALWIF